MATFSLPLGGSALLQGPSLTPTWKLNPEDPGNPAVSYPEEKANAFVPSILSFPFSKFLLQTLHHPSAPRLQLGLNFVTISVFCSGHYLEVFSHLWEERQGLKGELQSCPLGDGGQGFEVARFVVLGTGFLPAFHREPHIQVDSMD